MESAGGSTTLTTVLPGAVFGPILDTDNLGSVQVIGRLLQGKMRGTPQIGLEVVGVRDIADVHIRAMTTPEAGETTILATGEFMWMADVASGFFTIASATTQPGAHPADPRRDRPTGRAVRSGSAGYHPGPRQEEPTHHRQG